MSFLNKKTLNKLNWEFFFRHLFHTFILHILYYMKTFLIFLSFIYFTSVLSQETEICYTDYIYKDSIMTVQIYREGWDLSYPAIKLNSDEKLTLSFDCIGNETNDYYYKLIHCTYDWKPSDLMTMEYINGISENPITNYNFSFNTVVNYTHYEVNFPENGVEITKSGNYIILVYQDNDEKNIVLTKQFIVFEPLAPITAQINKSSDINLIKSHQEVDFTISANSIPLNDAYTEIKPVILQNGFWNTAINNLTPNMVKDKEIIYQFNSDCIFAGGSEFRNFDAKDLKYQSQNIREIIFETPYYHIKLYNDDDRRFKIYKQNDDLNGKYLVKANSRANSQTEADYINVYFTLPMPTPIQKGSLYIFGQLSNNQLSEKNKMIYNYNTHSYQLRLMLKQGYYNYQYILLNDDNPKPDNTFIEGSHLETENDYLIIVYYHAFSSSYDRIIGYTVVNSFNK